MGFISNKVQSFDMNISYNLMKILAACNKNKAWIFMAVCQPRHSIKVSNKTKSSDNNH